VDNGLFLEILPLKDSICNQLNKQLILYFYEHYSQKTENIKFLIWVVNILSKKFITGYVKKAKSQVSAT
jgi:hypothetical protein